ncbi:MAG: tetratricopeptide repeat protein [Candidatus Poribacteria bacterium]|nr:tetratricopeptide repeat protein [Candidatus Poribacteria bacterium]
MTKEKQQGDNDHKKAFSPKPDITTKLQQAVTYHQTGQLSEAEKLYQQVLADDPQNADAFHLLGIIAYQRNKYQLAIDLITQAIATDPNQAPFFNNLGNALQNQGKLEESVQAYQKALQIQPDYAEAYYNFGNVLHKHGKLDASVQAYQKALQIQPDYAKAYNNFGNVLHHQGKLEESVQVYQKALQIQPDYAEAYSNLGVVLKDQGHLEEAFRACQKAIKSKPTYATAHNNLGVILHKQGEFERAIAAYHQAIEISPDNSEAYNNLGASLHAKGDIEKSVWAYNQAIITNPQFAEGHKNLGMLLLQKGDFEKGWELCEWRWLCEDFPFEHRNFPQPVWDGSYLKGRSIVVWAEQGVGDEIMFTSILTDLLQLEADIMVECDLRLVTLFQRSFPNIQFFPRHNLPDTQLLDIGIDYQIPMGSLGRWLRPDTDSFQQKTNPYLQACPEKTKKLREKYKKLAGDKLLIGISWKSVNQYTGKEKSTSLDDWTPILSLQDCYFINLQYGNVDKEIKEYCADKDNVFMYAEEEIVPLENLDDFAAQTSALDLIISTSNTTVHMAGALGKNVWTLLPYIPDWRWMLNREDTLWYPKMKLFRQHEVGDWPGVFSKVKVALEQYVTEPENWEF